MGNIKKEIIEDLGFKYISEINPTSKVKINEECVFEEGFDNTERCLFVNWSEKEEELVMSLECPQDLRIQQALLYADRTGPISQEQVTEWQEAYKQLQTMDLDKIREKVVFDCDLFCELKEQNSWYEDEKPWRV